MAQLTTSLLENTFTKTDYMFDTLIRTELVDADTLLVLKKHCAKSDFYINESYGGLPAESDVNRNGFTDRQIKELGLPAVPNEVLRAHRFIDMSEEVKLIASDINRKCKELILDVYGKKQTYMQGGDFVRYGVGQSLPYHQDWTLSEWVMKHNLPIVHLSSVFYINDDYEGGELLFSSKKMDGYDHDVLSLKPKAGTIVFFDALQWHASSPVENGFKYASTNFYTLEDK